MDEGKDEDRALDEELKGNEAKVIRFTGPKVTQFRDVKRQNRTFRTLSPTADNRVREASKFRVGQFLESEFVDLGSYVQSFDDGEIYLYAKSKGKMQLPFRQQDLQTNGRGGGKTMTFEIAERFEKEKKECLNTLSRLAAAIERLADRKGKTT